MSLNSFQAITAPDKMMDLASLWLLNQFPSFMGKCLYMETSKDTARVFLPRTPRKEISWSRLHHPVEKQEKQQQFAQINSNLNPISGSRPISIGRIITECEASSGAPTVQIVLLQIYTSSRLMQECTACVAPFNTSHSCNCANVQRTQSVATVQRPPANSSSSC